MSGCLQRVLTVLLLCEDDLTIVCGIAADIAKASGGPSREGLDE
jgi:hypothetical protein